MFQYVDTFMSKWSFLDREYTQLQKVLTKFADTFFRMQLIKGLVKRFGVMMYIDHDLPVT